MSAPQQFINLKLDSGASANFHEISHHLHHRPTTIDNPSVSVIVPNGQVMTSKSTTNLPLPELPPSATMSHGFKSLASGSLLSVGQICDHDCTAIFTDTDVHMYKNPDIKITTTKPPIFSGTRDAPIQPLYNIKLPVPVPPSQAMNLLQLQSSNAVKLPYLHDRIAFYHATLFSPVISTWIKATDAEYLHSFPDLTSKQIRSYRPHAEATTLGHQHAQRSNLRSTRSSAFNASTAPPHTMHIIPNDDEPEPATYSQVLQAAPPTVPKPATYSQVLQAAPPTTQPMQPAYQERPGHRTHHIYAECQTMTGNVGSDQTGRFIVPSTSGNNYIFVLYDYDSNSIHAEPIPNRKQESIKNAYEKVLRLLQRRGLRPKLHRLDNEASQLLKNFMTDEDVDYQLTPAGLHRRNWAERAIQTFKNHFIAGLCSTHPDFPLNLWDQLLPQATLTLNLLRPSRVNPKLSAHSQIHGPFNFEKTPLAPPGIKVLAHEQAEGRESFAVHSYRGYYLGPCLNHYRCYRVYCPATNSSRIANTVDWFPHNLKMPTATSSDILIATAKDLTSALKQTQRNPLVPPPDTQTRKALQTLTDIFSDTTRSPSQTTDVSFPRVRFAESTKFPPQPTNASLPRVPTITTQAPATLPRVPPAPPVITTEAFFDLTSTNRRKRRQKNRAANKAKAEPTRKAKVPTSPQPVPPIVPPPAPPAQRKSARIPRPTTKYDSEINFAATRVKLPPKLQFILDKEIERASDPAVHPLMKMNAVLNAKTGKLEEYRTLLKGVDKILWENACSKEVARLAQGRKDGSVKGTETLHFINADQLPPGKTPTYLRICANHRPQKEDPYRVRWTVGGNLIVYNGETYTPTSDQTTAKILFNNVVSTPGATFFCLDLSNFYLETPFTHPSQYEYIWIPAWAVPEDIMEEYNLRPLIKNGRILAEIRTGMYGLPQAGRLAYIKLIKHLADDGYLPTSTTPGLFRHITRPTIFNLVVDDFGCMVIGDTHAAHLISTLKKNYDVTIDREGKIFCGIHLKWNYTEPNRNVRLSIPKYVDKARAILGHEAPKKPQHSPHPYLAPKFGKHIQYAKLTSNDNKLTPKQLHYCQTFCGLFNYYSQSIDTTMKQPVNSIAASVSTSSWKDIKFRIDQFLDYAATHPNAEIQYDASEMHLWIHSDASYLNESKARSRNSGYFYLSDKPKLPITHTDKPPMHNAPVHINSKIIDAVMSSVQESETGSGFINAKDAIPMRTTLEEMGRKQGPTPIQFDNKCAVGILTDTMCQRRSKAMDMRFYWLRDRVRQSQFFIYWASGPTNKADYASKNHPTKHHIEVRPQYVLNNATVQPRVPQHVLNNAMLRLKVLQKELQAIESSQTRLQGCVQSHYPNGQPKPLANRYNQYLSR